MRNEFVELNPNIAGGFGYIEYPVFISVFVVFLLFLLFWRDKINSIISLKIKNVIYTLSGITLISFYFVSLFLIYGDYSRVGYFNTTVNYLTSPFNIVVPLLGISLIVRKTQYTLMLAPLSIFLTVINFAENWGKYIKIEEIIKWTLVLMISIFSISLSANKFSIKRFEVSIVLNSVIISATLIKAFITLPFDFSSSNYERINSTRDQIADIVMLTNSKSINIEDFTILKLVTFEIFSVIFFVLYRLFLQDKKSFRILWIHLKKEQKITKDFRIAYMHNLSLIDYQLQIIESQDYLIGELPTANDDLEAKPKQEIPSIFLYLYILKNKLVEESQIFGIRAPNLD